MSQRTVARGFFIGVSETTYWRCALANRVYDVSGNTANAWHLAGALHRQEIKATRCGGQRPTGRRSPEALLSLFGVLPSAKNS